MDILDKLNKAFIAPGNIALGFEPQFVYYESGVKSFGGNYISTNLGWNYKFSLDALLQLIEENPSHKVVYIDNPNNPTGQIIPLNKIAKVADAANMLIVDEAYGEFMPKANSAVKLAKQFENIVVTRSFSKGFGLAGLRVGYCVMGKKLGNPFSKVLHPMQVNSIGLKMAFSALNMSTVAQTIHKIKREKRFLIRGFRKENFKIAETSLVVPIFLIRSNTLNLKKFFPERRIKIGAYATKNPNEIRFRVPGSMQKCKEIVKRISN